MTDHPSVGSRVQAHFEKNYAEWVRTYGGGHAQRWLNEELWPNLVQIINAAVATERLADDKSAKQQRMTL